MLADALGGLGGAVGNLAVLFGAAGDDGQSYRQQAADLFRGIQLPNLDDSSIADPVLREVAARQAVTYDPRIVGGPQLVKEDPRIRGSQLQDLAFLNQVRDQGLTEQDRILADQAQRSLAQEHTRANEATLRNLAARGRLGGGSELAARAMAGQQASEMARGMGQDLASLAVSNRLQGAQMGSSLASNLRLQDLTAEQSRSDAITRHNELMTALFSQANRDNAGAQERAQAANVAARQGRADQNVMNRFGNQVGNQNRRNEIRQQGFQNQLARANGQAGALGALGQGQDARQAARAGSLRSFGTGIGQGVGGAFDFAREGKDDGGFFGRLFG